MKRYETLETLFSKVDLSFAEKVLNEDRSILIARFVARWMEQSKKYCEKEKRFKHS